MKIKMNPNEMVVKAADCKHLQNGSPMKGKLILTTQRLYFNPEVNGNTSNHLEIYPQDIEEVLFYKDRILFPTGLSIILKDGSENKFQLKDRNVWSEMIVKMC